MDTLRNCCRRRGKRNEGPHNKRKYPLHSEKRPPIRKKEVKRPQHRELM